MGQSIAYLANRLSNKKQVKVLIEGFDGAGKTTLLFHWFMGEFVETSHTIGHNVEILEYSNFHFTFWDIGGADKVRPLHRLFYPEVKVVIFVVDSTETDRFPEVKDEISKMMNDDVLCDAVLLVLANKQDLPNALAAGELSGKLGLSTLQNRRWCIQASSAKTGDGIYEGLDWVCNELSKNPAT